MDADPRREPGPGFPRCDAEAVPWIDVARMREIDRLAIEAGLTLARMMENAGAHLALVALAMLGGDVGGRRIAVLAGRGGNGGGGLVAARRLMGWGAEVEVRLSAQPERLAPVPGEQLAILRSTGASIAVGADRLAPPELFLDAVLGYGQRGNPRGAAAELVASTTGARVLSLDAPSGLILADGSAGEPAVEAEATLTLALPKVGLRSEAAGRLTGAICLADLGIPPAVFDRAAIPYRSPFSRGPVVRLV